MFKWEGWWKFVSIFSHLKILKDYELKSQTFKQTMTHKVQLHLNWYVWINMHINTIYTCCIRVLHATKF